MTRVEAGAARKGQGVQSNGHYMPGCSVAFLNIMKQDKAGLQVEDVVSKNGVILEYRRDRGLRLHYCSLHLPHVHALLT
jgi:hypothetical protein